MGFFGVRRFIAAFFGVAALCGSVDRSAKSGDESPHSTRCDLRHPGQPRGIFRLVDLRMSTIMRSVAGIFKGKK
jgi:hypothetical protein